MENYWDVVWPVPESALAYVARNEAVTFSFSVSFFFSFGFNGDGEV